MEGRERREEEEEEEEEEMVGIVVIPVLMALRLRLSGKSIYSKGIADHHWPWPVFLSYLILSRAANPRGQCPIEQRERISIPPWGVKGFLWSWGRGD